LTHDGTVAHDATARRRAAVTGHRRDEPGARAFLTNRDPVVRATALGALARMEGLTADDVRSGLADGDAVVRRRAAELAVRTPEVPLVPTLEDPDHLVVEAACWALGERGERADPGAVVALSRAATEHTEPLCREAAVAALGAIGDGAGLAAILAATADKPAIRRRAVLALAAFEGPEVDAALQLALTDRDWQVRQAAEDLLR
jgi:HEAT repeat protein